MQWVAKSVRITMHPPSKMPRVEENQKCQLMKIKNVPNTYPETALLLNCRGTVLIIMHNVSTSMIKNTTFLQLFEMSHFIIAQIRHKLLKTHRMDFAMTICGQGRLLLFARKQNLII
jgi:hypothetical protein